MRLTQRYYMPLPEARALLTDIGTEELSHWEIIATIVWKLVEHATDEQIKNSPYAQHFANHGRNPFPHNAAGVPFTAAFFNAKTDPIADLHENMAAEQKARATYEHLIRMSNDRGVNQTLSFLREREVVHFQRFGEMLDKVQDYIYQNTAGGTTTSITTGYGRNTTDTECVDPIQHFKTGHTPVYIMATSKGQRNATVSPDFLLPVG